MTYKEEKAVLLLKLCCRGLPCRSRGWKEEQSRLLSDGEHSARLTQPVRGTAQQLRVSPGLISEKQR